VGYNPLIVIRSYLEIAYDADSHQILTLSHGRVTEADSSALGAETSALAQRLGTKALPAPTSTEGHRPNCPPPYTALYTWFEKVSKF
jgi:hypothetical protein